MGVCLLINVRTGLGKRLRSLLLSWRQGWALQRDDLLNTPVWSTIRLSLTVTAHYMKRPRPLSSLSIIHISIALERFYGSTSTRILT